MAYVIYNKYNVVYNRNPASTVEEFKGNFGVFTILNCYELCSSKYKSDLVRTYKKGQWVTAKLRVKYQFLINLKLSK